MRSKFIFVLGILIALVWFPSMVSADEQADLYNGFDIKQAEYKLNVQDPAAYWGEQEQVDVSSGDLHLNKIDLQLPGRNGLDVVVNRLYTGSLATLGEPKVDYYTSSYTQTTGYIINYNFYIGYNCTISGSSTNCPGGQIVPIEVSFSTLSEALWSYSQISGQPHYQNMVCSPSGSTYTCNMVYGLELYEETTEYYYTVYANTVHNETYYDKTYKLGAGWRFGFPSIEMASGYLYLHVGDGQVYRIKNDLTLDEYSLQDLKVYSINQSFNGATARYKVTDANGTASYFDNQGKWLGTQDAFQNTINVFYTTFEGHAVISRIEDTLARNIQFAYSANQVTVSYGNRQVVYNKGTLPGQGNRKVLLSVTNANAETTSYDYQPKQANFSFPDTSNTGSITYAALNSITYPTGSKSVYDYEKKIKNLGSWGYQEYYPIKQRHDLVQQEIHHMQIYHYDANNYTGYPPCIACRPICQATLRIAIPIARYPIRWLARRCRLR